MASDEVSGDITRPMRRAISALERRVTDLEGENDQLWMRLIMDKIGETNGHLAVIRGLLGDVPAQSLEPLDQPVALKQS